MRTIDKSVIDKVVQESDLVSIVSNDIELFKKGANYVGLCPFHEDNNPSFTVSPEKNIYKCFVCGAGGNSIGYMQNKYNLTFQESVVDLAKRLGINVSVGPQIKKSNFHFLLEDAQTYFHTILTTLNSGQDCLEYLHTRGYDQELINHFNLGYAPSDNHLRQYLEKHSSSDENYSFIDIDNSGLVDGEREFFNQRLVVPIADDNSRVVGFSARTLTDQTPKYINTRDSDVFQKRNLLYNLNNAKRFLSDDTIIFVEGFFDVFALAKLGINNAVGLMGTAFGEGHINLLKKYKVKKVIMLLDQDNAGVESTIKVSNLLISSNILDIKVVKFSEHKDIDEYIKANGEVNSLIKSAMDFFEFKLDFYKKTMSLDSVNDKKEFVLKFRIDIDHADKTNLPFMISAIAKILMIEPSDVKQLFNISEPVSNTKEIKQPKQVVQPQVSNEVPDYDDSYYPPEAEVVDYSYEKTPIKPINNENNFKKKSKQNENHMPTPTSFYGLTDEDVCLAYGFISKQNYIEVLKAYNNGNIKFIKYDGIFRTLLQYYKEHDKFDIIEFVDFAKQPHYFSVCERLISHPQIDFNKVPIILSTKTKKVPPGRDLVRGKRNYGIK